MRLENKLGIIGIIIVLLLTGYYIWHYERTLKSAETAATAETASNLVNSASPVVLDTATIAKHNNSQDCWMIINNNVYNFTSYISAHPGGRGTIIAYCGRDGTTAFATKDGQGPHSSMAAGLLKNYLLGAVGSTVAAQTVQQNNQSASNSQFTIGNNGDNDD